MIFDGDSSVFAAIKEKRRRMRAGESHDDIQPLIIFGGGLMKGAYGAGAALALEELGYRESFSQVVGVSSGAPIAAHFVAGTVGTGMSLLTEECCARQFINPWRIWNQVDTMYLMRIMRSGPPKGVTVEQILGAPATLYFGVSEYETGRPKLIRVSDEATLFDGMHASMTMQNVTRHRTYIDGVHYADGGFTKPHIFQEVIDQLTATHILVVTNNDRVFGALSQFERFMNRTLFRLRLNGPQVTAINGRREEREKAIFSLWSSGIPSGIVWGDGSVKSLDRNPERLAAAVESSRVWWYGMLGDDATTQNATDKKARNLG